MQILFAILITIQFVVIVLHDLLDIPGITNGRQVRAVIGSRKLVIATAINAIFPAVAVVCAMLLLVRPHSGFATEYEVIYCGMTLLSAIVMWYIPYMFGATEKTKRAYAEMYAGTAQILPARGDNPRPNVLHLCFHVLFVATLALAIVIRIQGV